MDVAVEVFRIILEVLGALFVLLLLFGKRIEHFLKKQAVSGENIKVSIGEQVTAVIRKEGDGEKQVISNG